MQGMLSTKPHRQRISSKHVMHVPWAAQANYHGRCRILPPRAVSFATALFIISGIGLNANIFWYLSVLIVSFHFIFQIYKLKDLSKNIPLNIFKSNRTVGLILTLGAMGNFINLG